MKKVTAFVMAAALILLLGYDVVAVILGGTQATISWEIWTASRQYPVIPFLTGMMCGHLFASQ